MAKLSAYIDSYEKLTLIIDKKIYVKNNNYYLDDGENNVLLEILDEYEEANNYKVIVKNVGVILHKDYMIFDEDNNSCRLNSGSIIRSEQFEREFAYDGPLGVEYSQKKTTFRIWSPVAKEIKLELIYNGKSRTRSLTYVDKGLWETTVSGDLDGYGYQYHVRVCEKFNCINDPYAISSCANGEYNYVINPNKLYKMKYEKPAFSGKYCDAIIYEASIRDLTIMLDSELKGTFTAAYQQGKRGIYGLDYVQSLGITHLQILPVYDFGGVDDVKKDAMYNWGYNPEQYFIPCGWYSTNPNDPYSRINELMMMIDECHKRGIRVNMDVVFNHVFKFEEFPFDFLVPGYFYRVDEYGNMSNASFCGNDLASERYMCSRFIRDALKYYASVFGMSGFRFDLMGLLDVGTLNMAYKELTDIEPKLMVYGEGWNMSNPLPEERRPHMYNHYKVPNYSFFNDRYRDIIRGSQFNEVPGFALGSVSNYYDLTRLLLGSCLDYYKFYEPTQSVNYVECHDNYTFYDYAKYHLKLDEIHAKDACRLAMEIIMISQGIPFIHAGQEFYRTKLGVENSYNAKDEVNFIDYYRRDMYMDNVDTLRDLVSLRKELSILRLSNTEAIGKSAHLLEALIDEHTFAYLLESVYYNLYVVVKNDYEPKEIRLHNATMIFDGNRKCSKAISEVTISKPGVYLFKGVNGQWN